MDHWYSRNFLARTVRYTLVATILVAAGVFAFTWKVLRHDKLAIPSDGYELLIAPGTSLTQFTKQLQAEGLLDYPRLLRAYLIYKNNSRRIQAGEYKIAPGTTAVQLLDQVFSGSTTRYSFTIIEGWQTSQLLAALEQHPKIKSTLKGLNQDQIIQALNIPAQHLEGIFLPNTYHFPAYTSDVDFLRRAYFSMQEKLLEAWQQRDANCIFHDPYQVLILASIIEKETSIKSEYAQISGVFTRRLIKKMKLQADPTVIYGLPEQLSGPLLRKHLNIQTAYNTYRNTGLPPTPIALPSFDAIQAALHPAPGDALYFVATGDGGHIFTSSLKEHNKAVQKLYKSRS